MKLSSLSVIFLVQCLVALLLLEVAGRLFDPLGISYYPETAAYMDTLVIGEPLGYRNRPLLNGEFFGTRVKINSLGMRDREIDPKSPGEHRIMVLGDSIPFGIGVNYEQSFPYQLEVILREQLDLNIRTLNMGVPSYNTEQEFVQLQESGLPLHPDLVMALFTSNDLESRMWVFEKRNTWYANLAQRSYAISLLYTLYKKVIGGPDPTVGTLPAIVASAHAQTAQEFPARPISSRKWQKVSEALQKINRLLESRDIPFVLFSLNESPGIVEQLENISARGRFPYLNLDTLNDPRWSDYPFREISNSSTDSHPNQLGNRIIATAIAESLIGLKLIKPKN